MERIRQGRVTVNGRVVRDAGQWVCLLKDRIRVDEGEVREAVKVYLMLHKPRGTVTTCRDERDRETVYRCLQDAGLPWVSPVGRLDKASEGLLLFTNDTRWASGITDPATHLDKMYHVQIDRVAEEALLERMAAGVPLAGGDCLRVKAAHLLRRGTKNCWLEITLDEGRNRHIRRLLQVLEVGVLRLVRISIGPLPLGSLARGCWRHLTPGEVESLSRRVRGPGSRRDLFPPAGPGRFPR